MARQAEGRAPSIDEAVERALDALGASRDEASIEVVQEADDGAEAVVRVSVQERPSQVPASPADLDGSEEQADAAADFLDELLVRMDIDAIAEPNVHGGHMYVDIVDGPEADLELLIGRDGQTLEAIQELTRMVVSRKLDQRVRVIVDVDDFRKQRETRLEERARELAEQVRTSGREEELEPMNSYERKLVHDAAAEIDGVETLSRGEDPARYVVIRPL